MFSQARFFTASPCTANPTTDRKIQNRKLQRDSLRFVIFSLAIFNNCALTMKNMDQTQYWMEERLSSQPILSPTQERDPAGGRGAHFGLLWQSDVPPSVTSALTCLRTSQDGRGGQENEEYTGQCWGNGLKLTYSRFQFFALKQIFFMMQRNDFLSEAIRHRFYNNLSFP